MALFGADVFASVPRKDQRAKAECYLRGLMLAGRRKSIQATHARPAYVRQPRHVTTSHRRVGSGWGQSTQLVGTTLSPGLRGERRG
ncbi:transposase [Streptomyces xylophagus]|uniref:transposase n=1 Tax=Streptomyces xylophagus TaxID=285514 RepID=UPI0009964D04|nr:transposase [Streptomyces xylophagus]